MRTIFKWAAWVLAGLVAIFIWFAYPAVQPIVMWGAGAAFVYHFFSTIIEETIKKVMWSELMELRRQSNANVERLERIDRKVSSLLRNTSHDHD
jgi:hypothetical protein